MTRAEDCMNRIISWMKKHEAGEISEHAFANRALAIANQYDAWIKLGAIELEEEKPHDL